MSDIQSAEMYGLEAPKLDWFLAMLVDLANDRGLGLGVTLQVGGFLVTGSLVSGKDYFEGLASVIASAIPDEQAAKVVRDSFAHLGDIYDADKIADSESRKTVFIHLKGARFVVPGHRPIPDETGVWWRGRLSEVTGFLPGTLSDRGNDDA